VPLSVLCERAALPYCADRKSIDYSKQVDFVVELYDGHGGLQTGGLVATDALLGSPVGGLDVAVLAAAGASVEPVVYSLTVRILERCGSAGASWLIARHAFSIRGAAEMRIVIGDVIVLNWVSFRTLASSSR